MATLSIIQKNSRHRCVLKSDNSKIISNYRPINILSNIFKIFKTIISSIRLSLDHILVDEQHM